MYWQLASSHEETVVRAELDPAPLDAYRATVPVWLDRRPDVYEEAMGAICRPPDAA
ncbi:hypothetical protein [Paraburkholderia unamae]|uniref:hypothetical protein n=1 Tax=Paraburkholderia unamae TaxID=219649 RepID=UPI0014025D70|nr:hypothetical protein [Paraburkholderia unamae]